MKPATRPIRATVPVHGEESLAAVHRLVDEAGQVMGYGLVDQTKLITAASELVRNIVLYAGSGQVEVEEMDRGGQNGLRLTFTDQGPGIPDVGRAMQDGYSTGKGMGLGLPGTRRLVHEFAIDSAAGSGTRVTIVLWKR
ncbi:serine/threonine-protein kinase RsbT [Azospirillum fermentarium]|uniref:anti-sigma regulatory factor n=1 Tax=Azospirillum fermentarium TaxID=1233114 RepID=UPI002227530A|nr:anti-sigma regulatory factor [Azospirillum fermentarium]MCW2248637.1 serine/threonine-protein kinase RsbT [Azospirillum fermentarium]